MRRYSSPVRTEISLFALIIFLILGVPGYTQSPAKQPPAGQGKSTTPPLKVTTRIVQVNVIAQDGNGHPVTGLTKEDFALFDQGQEQKIAFFSQEENTVPPGGNTATAPPPNTFSNRFAENSGVPTSVTVILLEGLNTRARDMSYARNQVARFLGQIQPQDHVALYSLSSNLTILHDFTQDASALLLALERDRNTENFRTNATEPEPADTGGAQFDSVINASNARVVQFYMNDRVGRTALAIKTIADHLAGLPGRKNLVWVSASFPIDIIGGEMPMDHVSYTSQIEDAARSLNNANVAIYPVDARGLIANPMNLGPGPRGGGRGTGGSPFPARQNFDTMNTMAERTGGRAFYNTNDIQGAVRRAIDDSRVTYVLGYYPSNTNWDGKFRELKVKVNRSGVHLRFRRGYYALIDATSTPQEKAQLMADAAWSPLESTELGLNVQADPVEGATGRELKTLVRINPRELRFEQNGDHWTDSLEVEWVEIGFNGRSLGTISKTLPMSLPQASYEEASRKDIIFSDLLKISDNAVELRLVTRDTGTGNIGSVNIPLTRLFTRPGTQTPPKKP